MAPILVAALLSCGGGCRGGPDPRALVDAAIEAHGGRERLAAFDNVKVVARGRFKGTLEMTGFISFVAPSTWAIDARLQGNPAMRFGMDGERCWRRDRQFVSDCSGDDAEYRRFGSVLRLRLLHGLDGRTFTAAGERTVAGTRAPAVGVDGLVLAFDPTSHRLIEISSGNWSELYSNFRSVDGAMVAASRTFLVDGALDVEDNWDEILPGQADLKLLHPPAAPKDGDILDEVDPERWVATTSLQDPAGDLAAAVGSLDSMAQAQGQKVSASDGFILTELPEAGRWELSVGLEPTSGRLPSAADSSVRFERWPDTRFVGVFHQGDPSSRDAKQALLQRTMDESALEPLPGSAWQLICRRESLQLPAAERLYLLRRAVTGRPAAG